MSLASIWLLNANGRVRVAIVIVCRMHVTIAARRFLFYSICVLHLDKIQWVRDLESSKS